MPDEREALRAEIRRLRIEAEELRAACECYRLAALAILSERTI